MKIKIIASLLFSLLMAGCGGNGVRNDLDDSDLGELPEDAALTFTQYFGQNGNLWKPEAGEGSSTEGLLVIVLGPEHTGRFDGCDITKTDGTVVALDCNDRVPWTHEPFSCVANGGREHWRAPFECDQAAAARIVCHNSMEVATFEGLGPAIGWVCTRQG